MAWIHGLILKSSSLDCSTPVMSLTLHCPVSGTNISIGAAHQLPLANHSFSVLAWVYIVRHNVGHGGDNCILGCNDFRENCGLHLVVRNGQPYMGFYGNDTCSPDVLLIDKWYHLSFVYDLEARTQAIYVNGKLSVASGGHPPLNGTTNILISEYANGRGLNGK